MIMDNPFASLEKLFHEPARLAITSALCEGVDGKSFCALKAECDLTDGNLNRHLKVLHEAGAVRMERHREGSRPLTIVHITDSGRQDFLHYLAVLERVLQRAAESLEARPARAPSTQELHANV